MEYNISGADVQVDDLLVPTFTRAGDAAAFHDEGSLGKSVDEVPDECLWHFDAATCVSKSAKYWNKSFFKGTLLIFEISVATAWKTYFSSCCWCRFMTSSKQPYSALSVKTVKLLESLSSPPPWRWMM